MWKLQQARVCRLINLIVKKPVLTRAGAFSIMTMTQRENCARYRAVSLAEARDIDFIPRNDTSQLEIRKLNRPTFRYSRGTDNRGATSHTAPRYRCSIFSPSATAEVNIFFFREREFWSKNLRR